MDHPADPLRHDSAALFRHLKQLGSEQDEAEWIFTFSHEDFEHLQAAMEPLAEFFTEFLGIEPEDFVGSFDEEPIAEDENGREIELDPLITLEYTGLLTEPQLASLHTGFERLATEKGVVYQGVETW